MDRSLLQAEPGISEQPLKTVKLGKKPACVDASTGGCSKGRILKSCDVVIPVGGSRKGVRCAGRPFCWRFLDL